MNAIKDARYNLGIAYLNDAQYSQAIPEFKAVIELDANYIDAHCGLSRAYLEKNELDDAETSAIAALNVNSSYTPALSLIDSIKNAYYKKGISCLNEKQYKDAATTFKKLLTQDSEYQNIHYYLGLTFLGLKEYDNAINSLLTALNSEVVQDDIHLRLGHAYIELKLFEDAIKHFEQALTTDPNIKEVHYNLALAYREIGNIEAATNAVTETLRLDPEYTPIKDLVEKIKQTHYTRGIAFLNDECFSDAVASFQSVITLDPTYTAAHFNLGNVFLKMESYSRAVEVLIKTVELDQNHKTAYHALALAYFAQHEIEKSRKAAQNAINIDPNYQPARSFLEAIDPSFSSSMGYHTTETVNSIKPETEIAEHQIQEEKRQAQVIDEQSGKGEIEKDDEGDPQIKKNLDRGLIYLGNKQYKQAAAAFKKVIRSDPNCVDAHYGLGKTYFEIGAFEDAISAAEKVLLINPDHAPTQDLLQMIEYVTNLNKKKPIQKTVLTLAAAVFIILFGMFVAHQYRIITIPGFSHEKNSVKSNPQNANNGLKQNGGTNVPNKRIKASLENKSKKVSIFAGEVGRIKLLIINEGDTLQNTKLEIDSKIDGLIFEKTRTIPQIQKNDSEDIDIKITVRENIKTQKTPLKIDLKNQQGKLITSTNVSVSILNP